MKTLFLDANLAWPRLSGIESTEGVSRDDEVEARDSTEFNTLMAMYCPPESYYWDIEMLRLEPIGTT